MIDTLPRLHIGQGRHFGGVSLFPLWAEAPELGQLAYADQSGIRATEREGSPVVHELVLANPGANPVLLLGGELFEGGWQHRALDADLILGPGRQTVARVSCVEAGRWHGHGSQVHRSRRASVLVRAAQAMTRDGDRQGEVWRRVSRYDSAFGAAATSSFVEHLDRRGPAPRGRSRVIPIGSKGLRTLAGQRGVLVGIGGQPAFLELFPSARALNRQLAALLQAVSMDAALAPAVPTPGRRARRLVERLERLRLATDLSHDAVDGRAVGGHTAYLRATGVMWQDQLAHATVFNPRHPLLVAA